ncbi:MAG: hypothetical protein CM1200mP26_01310 [Acidimicrobiales bacterium]|nr:MAG: hypothetical protein CM1200mP26_01310 [Acidimicrobiales bacterium]
MTIQADGKIVVLSGDLSSKYVILRYNSDGSLDTGFGGATESSRPLAQQVQPLTSGTRTR